MQCKYLKFKSDSLMMYWRFQVSEDYGYVLYSCFGSFYIPSCIMVFVYIKIYLAIRLRDPFNSWRRYHFKVIIFRARTRRQNKREVIFFREQYQSWILFHTFLQSILNNSENQNQDMNLNLNLIFRSDRTSSRSSVCLYETF